MSSTNYFAECPNCGKEMEVMNDNKPFEHMSSECLHCGFYCIPEVGYRNLKELNEVREDFELKKLKKLPEQGEVWG